MSLWTLASALVISLFAHGSCMTASSALQFVDTPIECPDFFLHGPEIFGCLAKDEDLPAELSQDNEKHDCRSKFCHLHLCKGESESCGPGSSTVVAHFSLNVMCEGHVHNSNFRFVRRDPRDWWLDRNLKQRRANMSYLKVDYTVRKDDMYRLAKDPPSCTIIFRDDDHEVQEYRQSKTKEQLAQMDAIVSSTTSFWISKNCKVSFRDYDYAWYRQDFNMEYCNKDGCSQDLGYDVSGDFSNITVGFKNLRRYCSSR